MRGNQRKRKSLFVLLCMYGMLLASAIQPSSVAQLQAASPVGVEQSQAASLVGVEQSQAASPAGVEQSQSWTEETDFSQLDELDFSGLDQVLEEQELSPQFDFRQLVQQLMEGEEIDKASLVQGLLDLFFQEVGQSKSYMIQIILLVSAFALLYQFANVFENAAVTEISFYIVYMILLALLMKSFLLISDILGESLNRMLDFMRALMPAFCLSMVFSAGTITATAFYEMTLLLIYVIEAALIYGAVPAVHVYLVLELMNHLTKEEMISRLTGLIKGMVEWLLKFLFTLVIGINVVQGLLTPVIDTFKSSTLARTAGMLPGFGNSINAVAEIMVGSGIIIKNSVGMAGILMLVLLCAGPLLKVGIMTLIYKLAAAVIQPIADARLSGCISGMGEGARLMGKILVTANVMLLVTIALVTAATTWNR